MSVFFNAIGAKQVSLEQYNGLSTGVKAAQFGRAGYIISDLPGWQLSHVMHQDMLMLRGQWESMSPDEQKNMIGDGNVVGVSEN